MSTFDEILPAIKEILQAQTENLQKLGAIVINRDLNGRVRLVVNESIRDDTEANHALNSIVLELHTRLGAHSFPPERMVLFEADVHTVIQNAPHFKLEGFDAVTIVDRLTTDTDWANIEPIAAGAPRIVFFSIKGGVGRSTALAVSAWSQAQQGKRVLVLDLDLESPGLSSSLLPEERRPQFGIADWLVEDLVDNGASVFSGMYATSNLSHDGEIYVVPAHGRDPGEYVAKLGRVWMSKVGPDGVRESWSKRLNRLLNDLEQHLHPDVILIDSRAGIDEVASACVTDLGACGVLLFAIDGEQTWSGYRILFRHWHRAGVARGIRERLQMVGAMIPELNGAEYFEGLRERAWNTFTETLYDEIPAGETTGERFSFDESDEAAPHYPWPVKWHRGFAALRSVHTRFQNVDPHEITAIFGHLVDGIDAIAASEGERHG
ncbi:KGGVGR-motif variant AAA ATPase [Iodobacter arcticus]|uniref:KGGVGR-motif variant AAA ATPase n=1 Tax=Iodobacter arcticus TaxID=590593 RepID=A0ABW2QZN2_9NEIS